MMKVNMLEPKNLMAAVYGALGFSDKVIQKQLGLTKSQIALRLRRAGVYRRDYRDGLSPLCGRVIRANRKLALRRVKAQLVYVKPRQIPNRS